MNSIIKRIIFLVVLLTIATSCKMSNADEEKLVVNMTVTDITEGGVKDLVFHNAEGDFYYINRGLENGFTLASAEAAILNKNVTLHLTEPWFNIKARHIAQLEVDNKVLYTEFNGKLEVLLDH